MTHSHQFETAAEAKTYALASNGRHSAKLTLTSRITGAHYTYQINRALNRETGEPQDRWFVKVLAGPDNTADYVYIAMIDGETFTTTKASKLPADSKPVRGFAYFWRHLLAGELPGDMAVMHSGTCGRCGRELTVPSSIRNGIGPECAARMGLVCN